MNLLKSYLLKVVVKKTAKANMLSIPKVIDWPGKNLIGYSISTTLKDNRQKEDIPPFYHSIYDKNMLASLQREGAFNMYCLFDMHANQEDFEYYMAVENHFSIDDQKYAHIQLPAGKYVSVELLKRNNKTVSMIVMYLKNIWLSANGFKERKAPFVILYDERFHSNYRQFGCKGNDYLGNPMATLFIPVEN